MPTKGNDFTKIHLTNGLRHGYNKGGERGSVLPRLILLVIVLGAGWAIFG